MIFISQVSGGALSIDVKRPKKKNQTSPFYATIDEESKEKERYIVKPNQRKQVIITTCNFDIDLWFQDIFLSGLILRLFLHNLCVQRGDVIYLK